MLFENPDQTKYTYSPDPANGFGVLWLPMPILPNGPGSKELKLRDAAWAKLRVLNPGVAGFEVLPVARRHQPEATVRIFGMATGETRIEAHRPLSKNAEAAVLVSVFPLLFPTLHIWFASDNAPSLVSQDAARLLREANSLLTPFTGIQYRLGRTGNVQLGVDVTTGGGNLQVDPALHSQLNSRLRAIPREMGTVGQLNLVLVRQFSVIAGSVGYAPDQPGDTAIVGENVRLPQTIASTAVHELGHCLGVPGNHSGEDDSRRLMHNAPRGTVIHREAAMFMRAGASRR